MQRNVPGMARRDLIGISLSHFWETPKKHPPPSVVPLLLARIFGTLYLASLSRCNQAIFAAFPSGISLCISISPGKKRRSGGFSKNAVMIKKTQKSKCHGGNSVIYYGKVRVKIGIYETAVLTQFHEHGK